MQSFTSGMSRDAKPTIAYFTVAHDERTGWTGGLLVLSGGGRPVEFQCTLPVRPARAHEILFGPTLRAHLIGEVIGPLLVSKCRTSIELLCCDQPEALGITTDDDCVLALVDEAAESDEGPISDESLDGWVRVPLAGSHLRVPMEQADRASKLAATLKDLPDAIEPFARIKEAIAEAHSQIARAKVDDENESRGRGAA